MKMALRKLTIVWVSIKHQIGIIKKKMDGKISEIRTEFEQK